MHVDGVDDGGSVGAVGDELAANIPVQQKVAIVHGDYRLDNTVLDESGRVKAILDWEICTLGDPMADLGLLLVYWAEPSDATVALLGATRVVPRPATPAVWTLSPNTSSFSPIPRSAPWTRADVRS